MKLAINWTSLLVLTLYLMVVNAYGQTLTNESKLDPVRNSQGSSTQAYNVRMAIHQNGKITATPQITMTAGSGDIISNKPDSKYSYKIRITLLDGAEIRNRFPDLSLQTSFTETIFVQADLYLPETLGQPVSQWQKIASPAGIIETNGQQLQVKTDVSSLAFKAVPTGNNDNEFLKEIGLDISAFPIALTQDQIRRAKSKCSAQTQTSPDNRSKPQGHNVEIKQCCSDGCLTCCWSSALCCSDETNCPGGGCCI
ncbi:MAG: hypothetical protein Q9M33_05495 [Robiginitomaculum sp.]|nr:hypothetical protein [Robiginitomaculum sp.]MDQ7078583.1 hypothetical protein [Robiginitomaculum sp.]